MVYDFLVTLKRPDHRLANIVSFLLSFIAVAAFLYFSFKTQPVSVIYLFWALAVSFYLIKNIIRIKKGQLPKYALGLALAALGWLFGPYGTWWMSVLYLASALAERELKFDREIGFTDSEIVINTIIKKRYAWNEVTNAMIKDGILTLDFSNNKLLQKEIDGGVSHDIELEFNTFCQAQLQKSLVP